MSTSSSVDRDKKLGGRLKMALIRWEPFREVTTLRRQMDQLFDELMQAGREPSDGPQAGLTGWVPAVEMDDMDANIVLKVELPGLEAKDLDIQVTRDAVMIAGEQRREQRSEEKGRFRSEFRYGKFQRIIPLPAQVQNDQAKADLKNGILTLTLPKAESERRRVVKVNLAGTQPEAATLEAGNGHGENQDVKPVETGSLVE